LLDFSIHRRQNKTKSKKHLCRNNACSQGSAKWQTDAIGLWKWSWPPLSTSFTEAVTTDWKLSNTTSYTRSDFWRHLVPALMRRSRAYGHLPGECSVLSWTVHNSVSFLWCHLQEKINLEPPSYCLLRSDIV
jgi:hypothetical protein